MNVVVGPTTVKVSRTLVIKGRLRNMAKKGVQLRIEALDGKRWRSFAFAKTTAAGTFAYRYHFRRGAEGRTFYFRVVVDSPIYPFEPSASGPVRVRVRR